MYFIEHEAQPEAFPNILSSMGWGVMTLTTVGYSGVYPITPPGKLLAAIIAVLDVGMFVLPAGVLASGFAEEMRSRWGKQRVCPHCGKDIYQHPDAQSSVDSVSNETREQKQHSLAR